jgi:hypothetical protein
VLQASDDVILADVAQWQVLASTTGVTRPSVLRDETAACRVTLRRYLNTKLRISLSDGRIVTGEFICTGV